MRKLGLLIIAILGLSFSSQASHLLGGEITWECLPNGQFRFYLTLFRDCSGINLGTSASISSNSPAGSISMSIVPGWPKDVSNDCTKSCTSSGLTPQDGIIQEFKYQSNPITLNGVPPATGWYFYYTSCCRPGGMANTNASNYYLRAIMYPYAINGVNQNTYPCFDNSPNFLEAPRVRTCNGYSYTYNNLASDKELDSLFFAWAPPSDAFSGGTFGGIAFTGGYSYTNPIPGTVTFNNKAGQINITGNNSQGSFVTCMVVEAYKDCQKVAEVYRDIPMIFQNCPNYTNSPPDMVIANLPGYPVLTPSADSLVWSTTVYAGQQVKFRITANDYDLQPNFLPQNVIFKGSGGQLGIPYTSSTNCLYTAPCATIVPVAPQTGYTKPSNNRVEFDWQTNCDHLSYRPSACSSPRSTYLFYLKMEDNACPVPATSLRTIAITVQSTIPQPPDLSNSCVNIQPNGDVSFDWVPPVDTGYNWDYYVIYKSGSRNGPFTPIDTIPNYLTTSYTDVGASNGPAFYVVKHFGGCDYFSTNSDTVAAMNLSITPIPPTNSSVAQLNWFAMHSPDTVLDYEIYRRTTNGAWGLIGGTQDTMYRDTVNICGANLEYQVRVNNSCNSNIVSGFFSDQNNLDVIRIDSVSVANGQSIAAWSQTTQGDATDYIVLKFIQGQGWVPVDTVPVGTQTWTYANSQATTMIENFKVVTMDSCGNVSSELNTKYHRNIWLRSNLDACDNKMRLSWNSYKNWPGGVQEYRVMVDETDDLGNFTPNKVLATLSPNDSLYVDQGLQSGYKYCYYIRAVDTSGVVTSTSNQECIDAIVTNGSDFLYMAKADVRALGGVDLVAYIDKDADVKTYTFERSEFRGGPFTGLVTIPKPQSAPWQLRYTDFSANTSSTSYFYRLTSIDSCDLPDTVSNFARSIHLTVTANGNLTNSLTWSEYEQYGGTMGYEVYRKQEGEPGFTLVTDQLGQGDTVFVDNVSGLSQGRGKFCYYVRATESGNPDGYRDSDGSEYASRSNQACAVHEARIFAPNAFNPESDYPENRGWGISNVFAKEGTFELKIINRWGQEVFSTTDPTERWDGTASGEKAPMGVYVYKLKYQSIDGLPQEERGTFTLIR